MSTHNETIMRTVQLNDEAVKIEQEKIAKLKEVRNNLVKAYKLICWSCKEESYLKDFIYVKGFYVDMDSDYIWSDFKYNQLECPHCKSNNDINEKILSMITGPWGIFDKEKNGRDR